MTRLRLNPGPLRVVPDAVRDVWTRQQGRRDAYLHQSCPTTTEEGDTMSELHPPTTEELARDPNTGVRWQAQMELNLAVVRERLHVISRMTMLDGPEVIQAHATVANAAATAALALAIANTGSDVEVVLTKLTDAVEVTS